jgi:hypothetical protein
VGFDGNPEGFIDNNDPDAAVLNQNVQIGMVQIVQPEVDPIFGNPPALGPSPEAFRLWVKFFSQQSPNNPSVLSRIAG